MAYTSDKKPGALVAATILDGNNNVVVEQSGDVKKATLTQVEAKVFDAKTAITGPAGTEVVVVRQTDNNLRQVALADIVPAGNITNAKISASAAIADTKLATINTAGKVTNNAVQAVSTNTANRIVTRDGSGNFAANAITATLFSGAVSGNVTGNVTGNASGSASTLATGRTIALTGDVTGTTGSFNGSANVSAATTIANNAVTTAKIADANVTTAKITNLAVTTAKIADANVTTVKIADANVTTAKIADVNVTTAKIADGAVTASKLASGAAIPAGAVMPFAMNSAPTGWLVANGDAVPNGSGTVQGVTADFSTLYAALSTSFGAAGTLPDLRGYFVRGSGTNSDGTAAGTFGQKQADGLKSHTHSGITGNDSPDHTHSYVDRGSGSISLALSSGVAASTAAGTFSTGGASARHKHSFTTSSQSPSGATETRPANIAMLYCIKF